MKKVQIIALHLSYGGIEKAISDLANNLSDDFEVEIVSTYKINKNPAYNLNKNINVKYLIEDMVPNRESFYKALKKFNIIKLFKEMFYSIKLLHLKKSCMIKHLKKTSADYIISTREFHNKLLGKYGNNNSIKIGWEHSHHHGNRSYFKKVVNSVKKLNYFVLVSEELFNDYHDELVDTNCKCIYIPNMIDVKKPIKSRLSNNNLICVSRFSKEKGISDLIDVINLVKNDYNDVKLNLIGSGPLYEPIKNYIASNKLDSIITLHGFKDSDYIHNELSNSSLYVMTSFTESFGISLLEAFSHGVPAIAFDSAEGARKLITNEKNGVLIKNRDKNLMAKSIIDLLKNRKLLSDYGKNSLNVYNKYTPDKVISFWKKILK